MARDEKGTSTDKCGEQHASVKKVREQVKLQAKIYLNGKQEARQMSNELLGNVILNICPLAG